MYARQEKQKIGMDFFFGFFPTGDLSTLTSLDRSAYSPRVSAACANRKACLVFRLNFSTFLHFRLGLV
jgi:hypothetical protein